MSHNGGLIDDIVPSEKALGTRIDLVLKDQNPIINSGLAVSGPEVDVVLNAGGRKQGLAYIEPLDATDVNISTDDINEPGESGKLTADEFNVIRHEQNWAWGLTDLQRMVTQYDVEGGVEAGIAKYWETRYQKTTVSSVKGVKAHIDAVLAYSGADADLLAKKAAYAGLVSGTTSVDFDMKKVFAACATAGEYQDMFDILIVHPTLYAKWQGEESSGFLTPAQTGTKFAGYKGYKLLKSVAFGDTLMAVARSGAVAFGSRGNEIEKERLANAGTGGGATLLHSRQGFVSHVQGTNYLGAVAPTNTVLENAATWELEVAPEHFGFRFINYKKPA